MPIRLVTRLIMNVANWCVQIPYPTSLLASGMTLESATTAPVRWFDNVWHHSDEVAQSVHGGYLFYGRGDTTLNPGGVQLVLPRSTNK